MKRLGIYVDVSNLYYCIRKIYGGKLDYSLLLDFIRDLGEIVLVKAYGAQIKRGAYNFIKKLEALGIKVNYKQPKQYANVRKADWDVGIAVDMIKDYKNLDLIVLCSADGDMVPVIEYLQSLGVKVIIVAVNISHDLRKVAHKCIEIPKSLLEVKDAIAEDANA
jgi:uncharacterized LabA/DUF88 family protein